MLLGCSPLYGFQMVTCVGVAYLFRLNKLAILSGAQISTPPLTPLVVIASIQVGHFLLHGSWLELTMKMVKETPGLFFASFAVGGLVIGAVLGTLLGTATAWAVRQRRAKDLLQPPLTDGEIDALYDRLDALPARLRHYGAWKVRLDPVYPLALPLLAGRREVIDLGAGMGLLGALLHARSPQTKIRCVEWDVAKSEAARQLLEGIGEVTVEQGDARTAELGSPEAICLFDVLHYSPPDEQRRWLTRCAQALAPGGVLVIRELDPERGRWGLAEKIEQQAVKQGWNRGGGVHAWPISQLAGSLRDAGLAVEVVPAGRGVFSANALVIARKG